MLIEIHIIQNHSPSNLNRDDFSTRRHASSAGSRRAIPASALNAVFAEVQNSRPHSSAAAASAPAALFARWRRAHTDGDPPKALIERVRKVFTDGGVNVEAIEGDPDATKILFFITDDAIQRMAEAVRSGRGAAQNSRIRSQKSYRMRGEAQTSPCLAG